MKRIIKNIIFLLIIFSSVSFPQNEKTLEGFQTPESVEVGDHGIYYVSNIGTFGTNGDGFISIIENEEVSEFVTGLDDPKGLAYKDGNIFVSDINKIWKIDSDGNKEVFAESTDFPSEPVFLNDLLFDNEGNLYVTDSGDFENVDGVVYKVSPEGEVTTLADYNNSEFLHSPNGLIFDQNGDLLVADFGTGKLLRVLSVARQIQVLGEDAKQADGLAYDSNSNLYISDWDGGKIWKVKNEAASVFMEGFNGPADITIDKEKNLLLVPEFNEGKVHLIELE